ncbi:MAG: hypothetical protein KME45_17200 [Stenomitos rutilans HA7619-LM2]|jgi:septal ring factor EnvC (AmiA/AmiB activator)|nr:hypothetical protein [Stenomitos rutilans HA7619-LM2]
MVKQRLFLGSVAFGISFGISFLTGRDLDKAFASGVTTTVATVAAAVVVDRQFHQQAYTRIADLKRHIYALQQRRAEAYHAYKQLEAEKEQLEANLQTLALPPSQPHLGNLPLPRALPAARKALSWNLSAPANAEPSIAARPYELPTEIPTSRQPLYQAIHSESDEAISQQMLTEATATKHKIEANLAALQAELSQIKGQITDHRQAREKLSRDIANVREEKRQLEATAKTLKQEVQELETCRVELEQFLTYAEAKKRELETGSNPLQEALKQLQTQIEAQQEELHVLEAQILDRRNQKEAIEQQLATLTTALAEVTGESPRDLNGNQPAGSTTTNGHSHGKAAETRPQAGAISPKETSKQPISSKQPVLPKSSMPLKQPALIVKADSESLQSRSAQPRTATLLPKSITTESPSGLPQEWTDFMVQLPEYELQTLKVIVEQNHPATALKHLAEDNLTMPELLIDAINERALETIGDLVIDATAGAGSAAIVREHLKLVKKLLKTYDELAH